MKIKGVIEDLKLKKKRKNDCKNSKIYLGVSLVVLWAVWSQFIFGQFLGLAYSSQDLQVPSYAVGTNYRVLIYCTCHFQGGSLCFSFFCLLVQCLISTLTQGVVVGTFLGSLVQLCCGEGGMLQTNNTGMCSQCLSHTGAAPLTARVPSLPTLLRLYVAPLGAVQGQPWAACTSQF